MQNQSGMAGQHSRHGIMGGQQGMMGGAAQATGVQDKTYNLISVLYHALQGGETAQQYLQDAQSAGDQELVAFFQEVQECQQHLSKRAKEMLMQQMSHGNGHEAMQGQGMQPQAAQSPSKPTSQDQVAQGIMGQPAGMPGEEKHGAHRADKERETVGATRGSGGQGDK
jgi:hypothetical protein